MKYLILLILLTSCKVTRAPEDTPQTNTSGYDLLFADDPETGVRCYKFQAHDGISCLRVRQSQGEK